MFFDIFLIAIIALCFFIGLAKGAAKMLLGLAAIIVAGILASWLSPIVSEWLYNTFFYNTVHTAAQNALLGNGTADSLAMGMQDMPEIVKLVLGDGQSLASTINGGLAQAAAVLEESAKKIVVALLGIFVIIILFVVLSVVAKLLSKIITKVFELPVLRTLNKFLGCVLGFAQGVVISIVLIYVIKFTSPLFPNYTWLFDNSFAMGLF
ncbi:MAG: CvpA family protein [Oscillospiraceae bacterium]|jgi:uncharacterized membrane protein required for colicin V production|nr:CvpA family protein [Oscillospiraceae bacterium]